MKKLSLSNRVLFAAASLSTLCSTGCANFSGVHVAAASSYLNTGSNYSNVNGNGGYPNDTTHTCLANPLESDTTPGTDAYTICAGISNPDDISLHGNASAGKGQVCVFPVDAISASQVIPASNGNGTPLEDCVNVSSGYADVVFTGATFNAAYVVQAADSDRMANCLETGNYELCPAYSYERWNGYSTGY